MDLEQLTKHQIVLLTLLISFVTSIATGIVTVSLMAQAPAGVTKVVNQIVEHTVEKIVPQTQGAAAATVTEKTVVVKDDDLAVQSIATVQKGIVRIVAKGSDTLIARGIITDKDGTTLTDKGALTASGATQFEAILKSGERVSFAPATTTASTSPFMWGSTAVGTSTGFAPVSIIDASKLSLGQGVYRIGGVGSDSVSTGVIASLPDSFGVLEASVSSATPGSIIISIFGDVIGMMTGASSAEGSSFYSIPSLSTTVLPASPTITPTNTQLQS